MRKTLQWLQQELRSDPLHACAHILESKKERKGLKPHQETLMKSILYTLKDMKIGGNTIKELMDTEEYHQGENNEYNADAYLQHKGRPTRHTSTKDQGCDKDDDPYCQGLEESTYDSDQECQEHDDYQDRSYQTNDRPTTMIKIAR